MQFGVASVGREMCGMPCVCVWLHKPGFLQVQCGLGTCFISQCEWPFQAGVVMWPLQVVSSSFEMNGGLVDVCGWPLQTRVEVWCVCGLKRPDVIKTDAVQGLCVSGVFVALLGRWLLVLEC